MWAVVIEPLSLRVTHHDFKTKEWPYEGSLKIAVLTDFHMIWPWMTADHLMRIVKETNALDPDIILLLGDYVATHPFGRQLDPFDALKPLNSLKAACGTFAVLGNHDYHPKSDWPEALDSTNVRVLKNQAEMISCNDQKMWIGGLDDLWYGENDLGGTILSMNTDDPKFMAMHNPDYFPDIPNTILASFAGHTHAGQIRFPFLGEIDAIIPSSYGARYSYGHIQEDQKDLFVSAGLGMTGLPIRFLNKPEVMVVTISKK